MEKSINDTLGLENQQQNEETTQSIQSAKKLRIIGTIVLVIGVLMGIILLFSTMMINSGKYTYSDDMVFNPMCIVYAAASVVPSLVIWAFAGAVADIVDNTSSVKQ